MARLGTLKPKVSTADLRKVRPAPKRADAELQTPAHRAWRKAVLDRAGWRCEDCGKGAALYGDPAAVRPDVFVVLYADHIVERRDGGDPLDPANGRCRCASCHSKKTAKSRAARHGLA